MAEIKNWQLNASHPYPLDPVEPKRQVAWVFDTNKCISCQTCTVACKTTWTSGKGQEHMFWNNVETKPWGFYPLAWDVKLLEMRGAQKWTKKSFNGKTIYAETDASGEVMGHMPEPEDWAHPNIGEDEINLPIDDKANYDLPHDRWMFYLARICNHCSAPACVAACPRKAVYKRPEDGVVLIDQERCRGYQKCVQACPYKKPMFNPNTGRSEKCISCYPLIEKGIAPRCVQTCIGKIRMMGYLNPPEKADANNPIDYLVHKAKVALPLYAQFGTMPNVYYIPPIHVDTTYLTQIFGPKAGDAVATYKRAQQRLIGLLSLFGSADKVVEKFNVEGGKARAFAGGKQVCEVPVQEPTVLRAFKDGKLDVIRHSVT